MTMACCIKLAEVGGKAHPNLLKAALSNEAPSRNMPQMALHLKESTCVARGTFNIYIFQPPWIAETVMQLPEGAEGHFRADFSQPGLQARFESIGVTCTIRPDSVIVTSDSPDTDCGKPVVRILQELPRTPLRAVGNNFTFESTRDETEVRDDLTKAFWLEQFSTRDLTHASIGGAIERGGATINMSLTRTKDKVNFGANVHRTATDSDSAIKAAEAFKEDRAAVMEMAAELFGIEVKNDHD